MANTSYRYFVNGQPSEVQVAKLKEIPGVYVKRGMLFVHENAAWLAERHAAHLGINIRIANRPQPLRPLSRNDIRQLPFLREWVPDFLKDYQVEGIGFATARPGAYLHWAGGCLHPLTSLDVLWIEMGWDGLAGWKLERMPIESFHRRFHEAQRADKDVITFFFLKTVVPRGEIRWNLVRDVVAGGEKQTLILTTHGDKRIVATPDHVFPVITNIDRREYDPVEKPLKDIQPGKDAVVTEQRRWCDNYRITPCQDLVADVVEPSRGDCLSEVYDIQLANPYHYYFANGILTHNSGKTVGAIVWGCSINAPVVVLTRSSVKRQWAREVERYTTAPVQIVEGVSPVSFRQGAKFIVLGWEILSDHVEALVQELGEGRFAAVADEAQKMKSNKRKLMVPVLPDEPHDAIVDGVPVKFVQRDNISGSAERVSRSAVRQLATSATPIRNRLRDYWSQLDFIDPFGFGSFRTFAFRYCNGYIGKWGELNADGFNKERAPELMQRLSFVVHHVPRAVSHGQLPPKRRIVTRISTADLLKQSSVSQKQLQEAAMQGQFALIQTRLLDACSRKRRYLVDLIETNLGESGKVVVFSGLRKDCDLLGEAMRKSRPDLQVWVAHGADSLAVRDEVQQAYMSHPGPCLLIATAASFGEGLSLHDTDCAIMAMIPVTPGELHQSESRFCRLGQRRPVLIYYPIAEQSVDEHYANLLLDKLPAVETVGRDGEMSEVRQDLRGDDEVFIAALVDRIASRSHQASQQVQESQQEQSLVELT